MQCSFMSKRIFIFILSSCFCAACFSQIQNINFRHITRSTGLPVETITSLAQDSTGFIWIGTNDGLFRFDGYNYKNFYSSAVNKASLYSNYIFKLYVDSKGRLWIATYDKGLSVLKPGTDRIEQVKNNPINKLSFNPVVNDIIEDAKGYLWFATQAGLHRLSPDGKKWAVFKTSLKTGRENELYHFVFDAAGRLLIAGFTALWIFDPVAEKFVNAEPGLKEAFEKRWCFRNITYFQYRIWFSTWVPDLGVYNLNSKKMHTLYSGLGAAQPEFTKMATAFYPDSKAGLWIGTEQGLHFVASQKEKIEKTFTHEPNNPYSIISNKISCLLEDRAGNIWVGTNEGISIIEPYKQRVLNYELNNDKDYSYADKEISDIIELDDHSFLIGTQYADGLYKTDSEFRVQKKFGFKNTNWDWIWKHYNDEKTKQVYISTQEGMLVYNQQSKTIRKQTDSFFSTHYPISSFVPLSADEVWMSSFRNIFARYNLRTGLYKEYNIANLGEPGQVIFLRRDKDNKLWIVGHTSGLLQFDEEKEKIVARLVTDSTNNSLRQPGVWVFLDLGESFLVGYDTHGISLYHKKTRQFEHFTSTEGLISNLVRDAFVAADKTVWIATANGISHFNPVTKTFINYNQANGIIQNGVTHIYSLSNGRIAAATKKGIFVFHPDSIITVIVPPAPIITEMSVMDKKIDSNNREAGAGTLQLSYKENYFSFDFISLQYTNNNLVEYAYQLEGLEKNWMLSGNRRFVSYANVPAGNYTFKIRCRMPGGKWVENKYPLSIKVHTAFYNRWWFFLAVALAIAGILYALFRYRLIQLLKLEKLRSSISRDLHDEVGASLTSISIFSAMARKTTTPLSDEDQYLQRIGDRSRESIDKMGDIIWSINPDSDSLEQMLVRMKNYTTEIANAKDIAIHWDERISHSHSKLNMDNRKNIYLLYKEAVNNVIKHSDASNIFISFQTLKNGLDLQIKDDGKGFNGHAEKAGNGLKNMKRRAAVLKGTIDIISGINRGTSIQLFVPY